MLFMQQNLLCGCGTNDSYPHSPTPVMSFVDKENLNTPHSSRRKRRRSLISLSSSCSVPSLVLNSTLFSDADPEVQPCHHQSPVPKLNNPPLPCESSPSHPEPVLSDLDLEDDLDTSTPPRPNVNLMPNPHHHIFLEPVVALIDCTAGNRVPSTNPSNPSHSHIISPSPDMTNSNLIQQTNPEPMVASSGCTAVDGAVSPNHSLYLPNFQTLTDPKPYPTTNTGTNGRLRWMHCCGW